MLNIYLIIFLVKVPVFFLHYWLLKAHVEASSRGSVILARGLLKIGRYGVYKIIMWLTFYNLYYNLILLRALFSSFICILQTDLKKIIALISVSHMRLSIRGLIVNINMRYKRFFFLNLSHTIRSCIIFYIAGLISIYSNTRLLYNIPFILYSTIFYLLTLILIVNIGVPPSFSFLSEMYNLSLLAYTNILNIPIVLFYVIATRVYRLTILNSFKFEKAKYFKNLIKFLINYLLIVILLLWLLV